MTGEEFMELYLGNTELRQYIIDTAKRRSKRKELQEEYVQEAWLAISTAPSGYETRCYMELTDKVIYSAYWQNRKEYILHNVRSQSNSGQTPERLTDKDPGFMDKMRSQDRRY